MLSLDRRRLLLLSAALCALVPFRRAHAADGAATVKTYTDRLTAIVNGPGSEADKRAKLQAAVDESVDVGGVAKFCLGRYWQTAAPSVQAEYVDVFRRVLMVGLTGQISQYQGVTIAVQQARQAEAGESVSSVVTRPNNAPAHVDWILGPDRKIIDVIAEGTSLRLTQRSDYASFLSGHGGEVATLVTAMKQKLASG